MKRLTYGSLADEDRPNAPVILDIDDQGGLGWRFFEDPDNPSSGPTMQIVNYASVEAGDLLEVLWEDPDVPVLSKVLALGDERLVNVRIPPSRILAQMKGDDVVMEAWYRLKLWSNQTVTSPKIDVRVKLNIPGAPRIDPDHPYENQDLPAPEIVLDIDLANPGDIDVVIRKEIGGPAWINMVAGDLVTLYWGDQAWVQPPLTHAQASAGGPLIITLTHAQLAAAGSGEFKVFYGIRDVVGNWSRRSLVADVSVIGTDAPMAPDVRKGDLSNGVIDISADRPAPQSVILRALAYDGRLPGDVVTMTWTGRKSEGVAPAPWTLTKIMPDPLPPVALNFALPIEEAQAIGEGTATLQYIVRRSNGETAVSRKKTYGVTGGSAQTLSAPTIVEAEADALDPWHTAQGAHVLIRHYAFMAAGDCVTLKWNGVTAAGVETTLVQNAEVEAADLGVDLSFAVGTLDVNAIAGGSLALSYTIVQDATPFDSDMAKFTIGRVAWSFIPPDVLEAVDGSLSPDSAATVRIGSYDGKAMGDRVTFTWDGELATGEVETLTAWCDLDAATAQLPVDFPVDASTVGRLADGRVTVSYVVEKINGDMRPSRVRELTVKAGALVLPPPTVRQAAGNVLDALAAPDGATVLVPANAALLPGKQVTVHWKGATEQDSFTTDPEPANPAGMEFSIPVSVIVRNFSSQVEVTYAVSDGEDV